MIYEVISNGTTKPNKEKIFQVVKDPLHYLKKFNKKIESNDNAVEMQNGNSEKRQSGSNFNHKADLGIFECTYPRCKKIYKSRENLKIHVENKHLNLRPYKCKYCDAQFSYRNGRIYHIRKEHLNYLPHSCKVEDCTQSFASRSALRYHIEHQHQKEKERKLMRYILEAFDNDSEHYLISE